MSATADKHGADYRYPSDPEKALQGLLHEHALMRLYILDLERGIDDLARAIRTDAVPGSHIHENGERVYLERLLVARRTKKAEALRDAGILFAPRPTLG